MDKLSKNEILGIAVLLAIASVFLYFGNLQISKFSIKESNGIASMLMRFDGGKKRAFEGPVIENMSLLQALQASGKGGRFDIRYSFGRDGRTSLERINDERDGANGKFWHFFLNGKEIKKADLGVTIIKQGDLIEARFE